MSNNDYLVTIPSGDRDIGILDVKNHDHNALLDMIANRKMSDNRILTWLLGTLRETDDEIWIVTSTQGPTEVMQWAGDDREAFIKAVKETGRRLR